MSARARASALAVLVAALLCGTAPLAAQQADSTRAGIRRPPSLVQAQDTVRLGADSTELRPPISPRRAFLLSFLLPGAGQARLDRSNAGGMFFLIEVVALTLVHRSAEDLRIARAHSGDSVPLRYDVDPVTGLVNRDAEGAPVVIEWSAPRYNRDWVRTRKLHYEDWLAVLFFNHLFAGADAFVAAQLWDLDAKVEARNTPYGLGVGARISVR